MSIYQRDKSTNVFYKVSVLHWELEAMWVMLMDYVMPDKSRTWKGNWRKRGSSCTSYGQRLEEMSQVKAYQANIKSILSLPKQTQKDDRGLLSSKIFLG